jgi:signal transduction histidine kinase
MPIGSATSSIAGEFARPERTEESLASYQRTILSEIRQGPSEGGLALMHHWWDYDLQALLAKSSHPRPRISVSIRINQKRNLIVDREPEDLAFGRPSEGCDWKRWYCTGSMGTTAEATSCFTFETSGPLLEQAEQLLDTAVAPGMHVRGDRDLLIQAFANLVENAIRHAGSGVHVEVAAAVRDSTVQAVVSDTGPGIPEPDRARVLRRFVRLEASRSTPGTGLGLTLVNAIADLHGAFLALTDNKPGLRITHTFAQPWLGDGLRVAHACPSGEG